MKVMEEVRDNLLRGVGVRIKSIILLDYQPSPASPSYNVKFSL
jgi:hypothetical protein